MLAEFNLGDLLWAMLVGLFLFMLIWMFIVCFGDILRRRDLSGGGKVGWTFLIFILPFFSILIYMISRPAMSEWDSQRAMAAREVQGSSGYTSPGHN